MSEAVIATTMDRKLSLVLFVLLALLALAQADYLWHNDEIPYDSNAKCQRGHSFYTNNPDATNTKVNVDDEVDNNLAYNETNICFFCICSVSGRDIACIDRHVWFCDQIRNSRDAVKIRDRYRILFEQDRPSYFRSLSFRLRRTMDSGIYALIENGGDAMCCDHPSGHRRSLHNRVNKIFRNLRRRVPKENLMSGSPANNEEKPKKCVPFVSEYSDCTDDNLCSGCTRCTCTASGEWSCNKVVDCKGVASDVAPVNEASLDNALNVLYSELKNKEKESVTAIPAPTSTKEDLLLDKDDELEQKIIALMRQKRSIEQKTKKDGKSKINGTVKFHHTVDELNEDTLKNSNASGMINAIKIDGQLHKLGRRTGMLLNTNFSNPLHIEYSHPEKFDHITDNKIEDVTTVDTIIDSIVQGKLNSSVLPEEKDKELSKLVVNELKPGTEIIGNPDSPVMSNITFTPENDTLTAMAFIAGNLLNKLWSMEKASDDTSVETEYIKHEKISDLLELFKEPLSLRQEAFLKDALERLSDAIAKHKDVSNVTLCETIEGAKQFLKDAANDTWRKMDEPSSSHDDSMKLPAVSQKVTELKNTPKIVKNATAEAINKINNVLNLMHKFENVNSNLESLKTQSVNETKPNLRNADESNENSTNKANDNLNLFGKVLEKITKLLLPSKKSKKFANKIKSHSIFGVSSDIKKKFKDAYSLDLDSMNLTAKDKIILDYITKVSSNPRCLLDTPKSPEFPAIEGGILLNLLEFFKIRSFVDLVKLLKPEKTAESKEEIPAFRARTEPDPETQKKTTSEMIKDITIQPSTIEVSTERFNTKDKLKSHLKSILEDLIELQRETGIPTKEGQIRIADVLPCIYNILNSNEEIKNKVLKNNENAVANTSPADKIRALFETVKKEVVMPSRRNLMTEEQRPKSAMLWERIVKNLDPVRMKMSRRNLDILLPKTFSELEKMMKEVQINYTSMYKNYGSCLNLHPAERLALLKTLEIDIKRYIDILKHIKLSMGTLTNLNYKDIMKIKEFTANVTSILKLNEMIMTTLMSSSRESKLTTFKEDQMAARPQEYEYNPKGRRIPINKEEITLRPENNPSNVNAVKYTRDEILNQLIKNRVQTYLKLKETTLANPSDDPNYGIAKNIMFNLDRENYRLARELYKVFVATKHQESGRRKSNQQVIAPLPKSQDMRRGLFDKMPVSQFEESKPLGQALAYQDQMVKQLLNMKNLRM